MTPTEDKWAKRFIGSTFILGTIAWAVLAFMLLVNLLAGLSPPIFFVGPAPSRVVAGGGGGSWFVMGVFSLLVIGVAAPAMTASFYRVLERDLGYPLVGWRSYLAWGHLILGAVGSLAASLLMTYGGYYAGAAVISVANGGGGLDNAWVHANVLGPLALPIALLMGVGLIGYLLGGIALGTGWLASRKK